MQQKTNNELTAGVAGRLCSVCGDISTGIHFGGNSCESCKAFFRRSVQCLRFQNYKCSSEERCPVNVVTRKVCQYCRYAKCISIGMKPKWVLSDQEREEKYGARRKRFRENRATEEDPDIYKYLNKEEKLLVEDIAHALYQSRATYPLNFPSPSVLFSSIANASTENSNAQFLNQDKPNSASANLLIVPIQRLVLFARMLKDFDLFSEDDKVCLLKGSAIEMMVCSSSTLFDPKTHTFTNYLSRDQRAVVDDQIMPLDPLFTRLWGEEIFNRTRDFLISMCNLNVDEVTSTLLAPVILFSPDRMNIQDLDMVKRLQAKYATVLRKYMNWRYGVEYTDNIYPKLLLQIVNIRTLSLAHGEVIQKLMATSNVNPLVQEVTIKQEIFNGATTDRMSSLSISSSPFDNGRVDLTNTSPNETESNHGSDDDDSTKKQSRQSIDGEFDPDNDDFDESDPRNIWRKRRKISNIPPTSHISTRISYSTSNNSAQNSNQCRSNIETSKSNPHPPGNPTFVRPFDHQVPGTLPGLPDDIFRMPNSGFPTNTNFQHLSAKQQGLSESTQSAYPLQQIYRGHSSTATDFSSFNLDLPNNNMTNVTTSPLTRQHFDSQTHDTYLQHFSRTSPRSYQQQQNEQQMLFLSLANPQNSTASLQSSASYPKDCQSHSTTSMSTENVLDDEEKQLLNAIHAHPNKRDIVLSLLKQVNETTPSSSPVIYSHQTHQQQPQQFYLNNEQQHRDSSTTNGPFREYSNM